METIKDVLKKPVIGGVTVGVIAATIAAYMLYKRYS
jgi:hypothetical protein